MKFLCDMAAAAAVDLHPTVEAASSSNHKCFVSLPEISTPKTNLLVMA
jgi:hypothetical protein